MQIRRRPAAIALAVGYAIWTLAVQPLWNLNIERLAEKQKLDTTLANGSGLMEWLTWFAGYIPSSFGLGFVTGALIFAYWDAISSAFQQRIMRRLVAEAHPPSIKAWVGSMAVYFDRKEEHVAGLMIRFVNFGKVPVSVNRVEGFITLRHGNGSGTLVKTKIHTPAVEHRPDGPIEPGYIGTLHLAMTLPPAFCRLMPDVFTWHDTRAYMDFADLDVVLSCPEMPDSRLKLWHSMRLTSGEWVVRFDETMPMFESDEARDRLQKAIGDVARTFGAR